jgi:hypothetical protein
MKWFFLVLLGMLAIVVGMLLVATSHRLWTDRAAVGVAMVILWLSLLTYWVAGYFLTGSVQDRVSELAHAALMLSIGAFLIFAGVSVVITDSCAYPAGLKIEKGEVELVALLGYLQNEGLCAVAGYIGIALGSGFLWPTLRLIVAAYVRRTRRISL